MIPVDLNRIQNQNRYHAILAADSPNNGYKYHRGNARDYFPKGVSVCKSFKELTQAYCRKNIELFAISINPSTDLMFKKICKYYKRETGLKMEIAKLGNNKNSFGFFVAGTASGTLTKVTAIKGSRKHSEELKQKKSNQYRSKMFQLQ